MTRKKGDMRRILISLTLSILIACTPRGEVTLDPQAANIGQVQKIYIGTSRAQDEDGGFGNKRSEKITFARYDVSVPPNRELGEIKWPPRHGKRDPSKQFFTTDEIVYQDDAPFRFDLRKQLAANGGEAVIFVHGYNNNFAEGVYRVAQFAHDLKLPGAVVHYAWPSAAEPLGYAFDRDSALFARDGLESLMHEVSEAGAKRILLVAHSMGAALTMEALRQTSIRGDTKTLNLIGGVILISPDIDVDVFRRSAHSMGKLPQPFLIFGSGRDKALRFSAMLSGQSDRLGSLKDVSQVADLDVTFLDVSEFSQGMGHFTVGDSAALISLLSGIQDVEGAFEADRKARVGLLPGVVLNVQNATQVILKPVARVAYDFTR
jgi:esterase/lipase superfamily enzyme